jgi:hypothetical protein
MAGTARRPGSLPGEDLEPVGVRDPFGDPMDAPADASATWSGMPSLRWRFARTHLTPKDLLQRPLYLPVVLNDFTIAEDALHTEFQTIRRGQFSQGAMGGRDATNLLTLTGETLSLAWDAAWLNSRGVTEAELRGQLFGILRSKQPVRLIVTLREVHELRALVTIRSLQRSLRPGEVDTRYYSMQISQWRQMAEYESREGRKPGVRLPTTHRLRAGDTLYSLAHEFYGDSNGWRAIRDANGISHKWGAKTPLVKMKRYKTGSKIKIPVPRVRESLRESSRSPAPKLSGARLR